MDGKPHNGILMVMNGSWHATQASLVSGSAAEAEQEWNRWQDDAHLPEILATGTYSTADRFKIIPGFEAPGDTTYLTFYQTTRPTAEGAYEELTNALREHITAPRPPSIRALNAPYEKVSEIGHASGKTTRGIVVVLTDCTDPSAEGDFNSWYDRTHIPDVVAHRGHHAATRYVASNPKPWQARYLAVYENEAPDAGLSSGPFPPGGSRHGAMRLWCNVPYTRRGV